MGLDPVARDEDADGAMMTMMQNEEGSDVWRKQLRVHDSVDARNPFGTWCSAQVIEVYSSTSPTATTTSLLCRHVKSIVGDAAVRCDPISRHEPYLGRAIASRFHASCDNFDPCTVSCDHCRVLMFNKAKNNDLPIAVGTPVHIFDTTTWREAHVTCTRIDHLRVLPADSPTDMWVPFTPQFVAPSEKQHARRILLSNSCFDQYVHALHRMNLRLHAVEGDGNCLFRAVSHQLYGDDQHHGIVRRFCMDYMELQRHFFEPFIVGDASAFDRYVRHKRLDAVWGDDPELQ
ncbi:hypothetical protein AaE_008171, partial [Aphanomyces astaci]